MSKSFYRDFGYHKQFLYTRWKGEGNPPGDGWKDFLTLRDEVVEELEDLIEYWMGLSQEEFEEFEDLDDL